METSFSCSQMLVKWTPRALAAGIGAYYGLGIAYEFGLMAAIDQMAMPILKHWGGRVAIGAFMPVVQKYAAIAVRVLIGLGLGLLYDQAEKIVRLAHERISRLWNKPKNESEPVLPQKA